MKKNDYLNELWENGDENILQLFFGRKIYFLRMVDSELFKLENPEYYQPNQNNVTYDRKKLENLTLEEIEKYSPALAKKLREDAFEKAKVEGGYKCANCGKVFSDKRFLQVDHIKPMNNGGLSVPENLQILCRSCNAKKSDKDSVPPDSKTLLGGGTIFIDDTRQQQNNFSAVKEIVNAVGKNHADRERIARQLENAIVDEKGKFLVFIDDEYSGYAENENWNPIYYAVNRDYTLTRFGLDIANYFIKNRKYTAITKDELNELKEVADTPKNRENFKKDAKFFENALLDNEGRYIVKNYIATDNCEMHMLVLKNFKLHRLFNFTAKKLYRENKAVKISPTELENMIKNQ